MQRTEIVKPGQTVWDMAMEKTGTIETAFEIAEMNNISPTGILAAGTVLIVPEVQVSEVVEYLRVNEITPASYESSPPTGIGIGAIGDDFNIG